MIVLSYYVLIDPHNNILYLHDCLTNDESINNWIALPERINNMTNITSTSTATTSSIADSNNKWNELYNDLIPQHIIINDLLNEMITQITNNNV